MKNCLSKIVVVAALAGVFATPAIATPVSLTMVWSGASFGNAASANGTLVLEDSMLTDAYFQQYGEVAINNVISLDVNIAGSTPGPFASHYDKTSFSYAFIHGLDTLDFSQELIGQMLPNACAFGTSTGACGDGNGGDFNLIASQPGVPNGTWYFEFTQPTGERMLLTSLRVSSAGNVPEPASLALFGLALAGIAAAGRRKSSRGTAEPIGN